MPGRSWVAGIDIAVLHLLHSARKFWAAGQVAWARAALWSQRFILHSAAVCGNWSGAPGAPFAPSARERYGLALDELSAQFSSLDPFLDPFLDLAIWSLAAAFEQGGHDPFRDRSRAVVSGDRKLQSSAPVGGLTSDQFPSQIAGFAGLLRVAREMPL
jgi:hypothetical protein